MFLSAGLFTGYSALGAALAIPPGGVVVGMDIYAEYYDRVGRPLAEEAGVSDKIRVVIQPARRTMGCLTVNDDGTSTYVRRCRADYGFQTS